jgi:hypothetical protein
MDLDDVEAERGAAVEEREEADILEFFAKRREQGEQSGPSCFIPPLECLLLQGVVSKGDRYYCEPRKKRRECR